MLNGLYIKNFALINSLDQRIEQGFTVLTGETGAGKSILLGALQLALGGSYFPRNPSHSFQKKPSIF